MWTIKKNLCVGIVNVFFFCFFAKRQIERKRKKYKNKIVRQMDINKILLKHSYSVCLCVSVVVFFVHSLPFFNKTEWAKPTKHRTIEMNEKKYMYIIKPQKRSEKNRKNGLFNSFHFIAFVCISLKCCGPFGSSTAAAVFFILLSVYIHEIFSSVFSFLFAVVFSVCMLQCRCFSRILCVVAQDVFDCRHCQYMWMWNRHKC